MFVTKSTYERLAGELNAAVRVIKHLTTNLEAHKRAFERVTKNWNELVEKINAKGGEDFLEHATLNGPSQFTKEEVDRLIRLCHPDKHNGSEASTKMTQKLLDVRNSLK